MITAVLVAALRARSSSLRLVTFTRFLVIGDTAHSMERVAAMSCTRQGALASVPVLDEVQRLLDAEV